MALTECTGDSIIINPPADPPRGGNCCEAGFFVKTYNCTTSKSIEAGEKGNLSFPYATEDGYTPIGIVGYSSASSQVGAITMCKVGNDGYINFEVFNPTSSSIHVYYSVNVLFVKSDFIKE